MKLKHRLIIFRLFFTISLALDLIYFIFGFLSGFWLLYWILTGKCFLLVIKYPVDFVRKKLKLTRRQVGFIEE